MPKQQNSVMPLPLIMRPEEWLEEVEKLRRKL